MNNRHRIAVNLLAAGVTALLGASVAQAHDVYLSARVFNSAAAGGATMWGYAECRNANFTSCGAPSSPGPEIAVPVGETTLTIHLQNTLPVATSVMIPGQRKKMIPVAVDGRIRAFDVEAGPGDVAPTTKDYVWTDLAPGTYLYQSASHVQLQVQMGLYGAMTRDYLCQVSGGGGGPPRLCGPGNGVVAYAYGEPVATTGFEFPETADGLEAPGATGWQATGPAGVFNPASEAILVPSDGQQAGWTSSGGQLVLPLGNVAANVSYDVSVDIGARSDRDFAGYDVGVYAGSTRLDGASGTTTTAPSGSFQTWSHRFPSVDLEAYVGSALELRLASTVPGDQSRTMFDRVTVTRADMRSEYDTSKVLVFSEVDPALHDDPVLHVPAPKAANATPNGYLPRYFLINGEVSPANLVTVRTGERLLLRLVNAGLQSRAPQLLGGTFEIVAEDGHVTPVSHQQYNTLLPAGKALDLLFVAPAPGTYTLYDRRLGLSNGGGQVGHIVVTN
jgi:hypothetical protein